MKLRIGMGIVGLSLAVLAHAQNENTTTLSVSNEPIDDIMQILSDATGLSIVVSSGASGKTISAFIPSLDAEDALENIVEANGLHLVRNGDVVWVLSPEEYLEDLDIGRKRRVVRLEHARVERLLPVVSAVLSASARINAYPELNVLVIADVADRIDSAVAIVKELDAATTTRVFQLQHAAAADMMKLLTPHVSDAASLYADFRTNQINVTGTIAQLDRIDDLLDAFDRPDLVVTKTVPLQYANADAVAEILREVLTGRRTKENSSGAGLGSGSSGESPETNTPTALPGTGRTISPIGSTLQTRSGQSTPPSAPSQGIATQTPSPLPTGPSLATGDDSDGASLGPLANITPDTRTNTVIITHTAAIVERLEAIIKTIDVPDEFQHYQFKNVNPAEIDIEGKLSALLPAENAFLAVDPISRIVTFRSSASHALQINELLESWDKHVRQVRIDGEVLRVNISVAKSVGINWNVALNNGDDAAIIFPPPLATSDPRASINFGGLDYTAAINALASDSDTQTLASPRIVVRDGGEALFSTARDEPYTVVTVDGNTQTTLQDVRFLNVGVNLSVAPVINRDQLVTLDVALEISELVEVRNGIPVVDRSTAQSSVSVNNGNTLILGGLRQTQRTEIENGVPILRKIPILGNIFRNTTTDDAESVIILVLRPTILDYPNDNPPSLDVIYNDASQSLGDDAQDWRVFQWKPRKDTTKQPRK